MEGERGSAASAAGSRRRQNNDGEFVPWQEFDCRQCGGASSSCCLMAIFFAYRARGAQPRRVSLPRGVGDETPRGREAEAPPRPPLHANALAADLRLPCAPPKSQVPAALETLMPAALLVRERGNARHGGWLRITVVVLSNNPAHLPRRARSTHTTTTHYHHHHYYLHPSLSCSLLDVLQLELDPFGLGWFGEGPCPMPMPLPPPAQLRVCRRSTCKCE